MPFKIGLRIEKGVLWPVEGQEAPKELQFHLGPLKVFLVISLEEKLSSGDEDRVQGAQKFLLHEASPVMLGFGPGIRKKEVEAAH